MKNVDYRVVARSALKDRGFDVRIAPGQGYLPGSRLVAARLGKEIAVAVKASQERTLSFTKQPGNRWRTLSAVELVIAVVPDQVDRTAADVFAFERKVLVRAFNRAWKALEIAKRPISFNTPVFVPIDEVPRKNLGHEVGGLEKLAAWSIHITEADLEQRISGSEENYVEEFRRRFASENGIDVSQVTISIAGKK